MKRLQILVNGIIKENPVLVLVLGTCPTLATSTSVLNGLGMGVAATFVLLGSNVAISLLKAIIPDKVRIPCYIVVIAGFVTVVQLLMQAYVQELYRTLGLFIPLIVVNCIILGRAEMFANKNSVVNAALDAIGMGLGFTFALFCMGTIREILGNGSWCNIPLTVNLWDPIKIMTMAPGGFFTFGLVIAMVNKLTHGRAIKKKEVACSGCPSQAACQQTQGEGA